MNIMIVIIMLAFQNVYKLMQIRTSISNDELHYDCNNYACVSECMHEHKN